MSPFLILIFLVPSAIIFFLGRYIGNTQYVEVLKSYDDRKLYDKKGLSEYVRKLMYFTSIGTASFCIVFLLVALILKSSNAISFFLIVYALITVNYMIRLRLSCKKFEIGENNEKSRHLEF
jgi:putative flippase GtrA